MAFPNFDEVVRNFIDQTSNPGHLDFILGRGWQHEEAQKDADDVWYKNTAKAVAKTGVASAASTGLTAAITHSAPCTEVATGINCLPFQAGSTVNPVTWALQPWTTGLQVAFVQWGKEDVYALMEDPHSPEGYRTKTRLVGDYPCSCNRRKYQGFVWKTPYREVQYSYESRQRDHKTCKDIAQFYHDQMDYKVAKLAVNATIVVAC